MISSSMEMDTNYSISNSFRWTSIIPILKNQLRTKSTLYPSGVVSLVVNKKLNLNYIIGGNRAAVAKLAGGVIIITLIVLVAGWTWLGLQG